MALMEAAVQLGKCNWSWSQSAAVRVTKLGRWPASVIQAVWKRRERVPVMAAVRLRTSSKKGSKEWDETINGSAVPLMMKVAPRSWLSA